MPITSATSSPPDSGFTPRKEFIRDRSQPNTFAILALSSSNFLRLYSFSQPVIRGLQSLFEKQSIDIACREDAPQNLYELSIDHKPWANPKSIFTEKLLLDIFSLIYQAGYTFLSCIDYGREPDDRIVMAFSRPSSSTPSSGSRAASPQPPTGSPLLNGSHQSIPEQGKPVQRVPFALSFASTTVMRVVSPPLHLTPAILQAVRGSWPRGVVSEKKVGENCFEFKLKGYKWFQQDNFATDSLQHILSLLGSLDGHSFTLLTSLTLTNRSRVKDLWIFTGPAPAGNDLLQEELFQHGHSQDHFVELRRPSGEGNGTPPEALRSNQHRRLATETNVPPAQPMPMTSHHSRSATEDMSQRHAKNNNGPMSPHQPHLLRKPAPRAQVPVSVAHESDREEDEEEDGYPQGRVNLPSMISSNSPNMTGIGAVGQDKALPFGAFGSDVYGGSFPAPPREHQDPPNETAKTALPSLNSPPSPPLPQPLLSPGTFRDSALSSQSDVSHDIPIKWTGAGREDTHLLLRSGSGSVGTPKFPGGWQTTPINEETESSIFTPPETPTARTPIYETMSRVEAPEIVQPNVSLRKSEAVVFGMITATSPPPLPSSPLSAPPRSPAMLQDDRVPSKRSDKSAKNEGSSNQGGQGWVLVNVEGSADSRPQIAETHIGSSLKSGSVPEGQTSPNPQLSPSPTGSPGSLEQPSHTAKAIVIMDAIESKHKKTKSASASKESGEGGGVRRFFSLNRKNSRKVRATEGGQVAIVEERERTTSESKSANTTIPRSAFRDMLRTLGTPEATRREDKLRDLD